MVGLFNLFMLYAFVMNYPFEFFLKKNLPVGPKHTHAVTYHQIAMFKKRSFENMEVYKEMAIVL